MSPHPPMYPCPSVSTLLPLALSATQTPVLISPCMPASPRPLTPIKPHWLGFFFFFFFRVGGFSWPFMICLYPSDWFTLTMTQSSHKFWLIADTIQASLFYSYLLNYTFSLYLNLTVLPFFSQAASYLFIPPTTTANRTMTTRHRCTVPPSTATLGWCGCCWRNSLIPPWGITSLRLRWTWQHCTAAWRLSNCCSVPILICSAATPRNTHHYTWPLATDTYP